MMNKILMVEKEIGTVQRAQERLIPAGYEVLSAQDGRMGFQIAKDKAPNLIIADAMSPIMSGFELCKAIKNDESTKSIPIVVMREHSRIEDSFIFLGVKDFLKKPVCLDDLEQIVRNKLNLAKSMSTQKSSILIYGKFAVLTCCETLFETDLHWRGYYSESNDSFLQKAFKYTPDVILMDLQMPGESVDEMIAKIKMIPELKDTIILTYYSNATSVVENSDNFALQVQMIEVKYMRNLAQVAGAKEYLGPFNPVTFLKLIDMYRKDLLA